MYIIFFLFNILLLSRHCIYFFKLSTVTYSKPHNFVNYIILIFRSTTNETTLKSLLKVKFIRLTQHNNNAQEKLWFSIKIKLPEYSRKRYLHRNNTCCCNVTHIKLPLNNFLKIIHIKYIIYFWRYRRIRFNKFTSLQYCSETF